MGIIDQDFSKIPHQFIDSGIMGQLTGNEIKILLTINRFADYDKGLAFPSVETIKRLAGVNKNSIAPAIKKFVSLGILDKKRGGKKLRFKNIYKMLWNFVRAICIHSEKPDKSRVFSQGEDGKFQSVSLEMQGVIPGNMENDVCPQILEKKETREINNNDRAKSDFFSFDDRKKHKTLSEISQKTLCIFMKDLGGIEHLKKHLIKIGYPANEVNQLSEDGMEINEKHTIASDSNEMPLLCAESAQADQELHNNRLPVVLIQNG